uniref:Ig-like domain-containing protein n=1 Tax=Urocitellus parryii TaxID=9999 RepID=A0A8D2KGI2_UROPR
MGTHTLYCVALCVLVPILSFFTEHTDAGVIQTPRHEVTEKRQAVTLRCEPISGHTHLFWYRQTAGKELEFLIYFSSRSVVDDKGMPKDRFSAEMPSASSSTLKIQPTEPKDSAVYLCASSSTTALQDRPLQVQKPWRFS